MRSRILKILNLFVMSTSNNIKKLNEIAKDAYRKRGKLISLYKKQGKGNAVIKLKHGCTYVYGETIKTPEICFNAGNSITDMELWSKTIWSKEQRRKDTTNQ